MVKNYYENKLDKRGKVNDVKDVRVLIEITDKCNCRCLMCKHSWSKNMHGGIAPSFMEPGIFIKLINELKMSRLKPISIDPIWAGESLMHPDFNEMISYMFIANKRFQLCKGTVINTNAFYLNKTIADTFLDYGRFVQEHAKEGYYFRLYFSLDAATPETYAKMRNVSAPAMGRVLENISYFMQKRKERKIFIPNVIFIFVITEENKHEARQFLKYWRGYLEDLDADFEILPTWPLDTTKDAIYFRQLISPDIDKAIKLHRDVCMRLGLIPKSSGKRTRPKKQKTMIVSGQENSRRPCAALWRTPNVQASGVVVPCCRDIDLFLNLGNLRDNTIDEIWFGEKIKDIRAAHLGGDLSKYPVCANCVEPEGQISEEDVDSLSL